MPARKKPAHEKPTRRTSSRVKADRIDFRDCLYTPPVGAPSELLFDADELKDLARVAASR